MSEPLPPPSFTAPEIPAFAHRGSPPPRAGTFRPRATPRVNDRPAPVRKAASNIASVLKLCCLLGLIGFSVVQYQNHREAIRDSLKIENASSVAIEDGGNLNLFLVKFTHQGTPGVLLWKSAPGEIELVAGPENSLQSLSGHKLRYDTLGRTNDVTSDYTVVALPEDQVQSSTSPHAYNLPEITSLLPVIRQ